jgi:hypothetical protein
MSARCSNCDAPGAEPIDLVLRGDEPTEAHLCDPCRDALKDAVDVA